MQVRPRHCLSFPSPWWWSWLSSAGHRWSGTAWRKLKALLYDILPSATAVLIFSYAIGSRKLSANEQFFVGAQTVVSLWQTAPFISDICFMLPFCLRQLKQNQNRLNRDGTLFFLTRCGCVSCLRACLGARLLPQSYQYPVSYTHLTLPTSVAV